MLEVESEPRLGPDEPGPCRPRAGGSACPWPLRARGIGPRRGQALTARPKLKLGELRGPGGPAGKSTRPSASPHCSRPAWLLIGRGHGRTARAGRSGSLSLASVARRVNRVRAAVPPGGRGRRAERGSLRTERHQNPRLPNQEQSTSRRSPTAGTARLVRSVNRFLSKKARVQSMNSCHERSWPSRTNCWSRQHYCERLSTCSHCSPTV